MREGLFQPLARHAPNAVVAWHDGKARRRDEFLRQVASLAGQLPEFPGDAEVLNLCTDRWSFAVSALATWKRGYSMALPPNTQEQTVFEFLARGAVRVMVHDGEREGGIDVRTTAAAAAHRSSAIAWAPIAPDRPIATLYTSGTTGPSRSCVKTAEQLFGEADLLGDLLGIVPSDRILATPPAQHIYGLLVGILVPLIRGASMICGPAFHAESLAASARQNGATVLVTVPAHLRALAHLGAHELGDVRLMVSSSAPLEQAIVDSLRRFRSRLVELLGSTETGGIATREPPETSWRPLPGLSVSSDSEGHLLVDSPFLPSDEPRPYVTSDLVRFQGGGTFAHLGRIDGVVKIAGKRVVVAELEERLRSIPGVADAALTAVQVGGGRSQELWGLVVANDLTTDQIRSQLLAWFDPVTLPRRLKIVARIPREAGGKVTRDAMLAAFGERATRPSDGSLFDIRSRASSVDGAAPSREVGLVVPKDLRYFSGHFVGYPILSGVAILNALVISETRSAWPELGMLRSLSRVKFRHPIGPGTALNLRLRRTTASVAFRLADGDKIFSSGVLDFEATP